MSESTTLTGIKRIFKSKGEQAMKNARETMIREFRDHSYSSQALRYFSRVTLRNALPVFPALISIACEAIGGDAKKATDFGEAIVLISAAADLHDDVIDQSLIKGSKQTVLGKFNAGTAILAGDILLVKGNGQLVKATESIPRVQASKIMELLSNAVFEICRAEALEIEIRKKPNIEPEGPYEVLRLKAVVPELCMKIGAIIGNGDEKDIESLGYYGRTYGINSLIIEEFADLLNIDEFRSRLRNEYSPLPMILALQNPEIKKQLLSLLNSDIDEAVHKKAIDTILNSAEVENLQKDLLTNAVKGTKQLPKEINRISREELANILFVPLKCFGI